MRFYLQEFIILPLFDIDWLAKECLGTAITVDSFYANGVFCRLLATRQALSIERTPPAGVQCVRHNEKKPSRREYGFSVFTAVFL